MEITEAEAAKQIEIESRDSTTRKPQITMGSFRQETARKPSQSWMANINYRESADDCGLVRVRVLSSLSAFMATKLNAESSRTFSTYMDPSSGSS
jgi:hypothetical protein